MRVAEQDPHTLCRLDKLHSSGAIGNLWVTEGKRGDRVVFFLYVDDITRLLPFVWPTIKRWLVGIATCIHCRRTLQESLTRHTLCKAQPGTRWVRRNCFVCACGNALWVEPISNSSNRFTYELGRAQNRYERQLRVLAAEGKYSSKDIDAIYQKQRGQCRYCKKRLTKTNTTIDHIVPIVLGGSHWPSNLCLACRKCNGKKSNLTVRRFMRLLREEEALRLARARRKEKQSAITPKSQY
jgi:5-methylcytosine-specific restriction endonuclease McrA